jgi:hypothetical protein
MSGDSSYESSRLETYPATSANAREYEEDKYNESK